jgi:methionyl-tRNA formyltransferase
MTKILFMGRKPVARDCLAWLLEQAGVEIVGVLTDSHLEGSVTTAFARSAGLDLYTFDEALAAMEAGDLIFDLGLSILYWRKLRGPFLTVPNLGIVNFHPAPLPKFKGVGGYNLAILEGLDHWAASAHYVDAEIDTGAIVQMESFPIDVNSETAQSLERKSQRRLQTLFVDVVTKLLAAGLQLPTKPNFGGRYLSRLELEEMKRVDFDKDDVERKVRAFWFPPYDGAFVECGGEKFTLVNRSILESLADPSVSSLFSPAAKERKG